MNFGPLRTFVLSVLLGFTNMPAMPASISKAEVPYEASDNSSNVQAERLLKRGLSRASRGDQEGALADLHQALRLNPQQAKAYLGLAKVYSASKDYAAAI